ncbi:MAG: DUF6265 family protein, partial [Thermoanaerobaculia bacterium]|nr:DUF6265 family protein [Thermoanaerobaculia bacterium]
LAWMAGCWEGQGGGGANRECWTAPGGGLMLGVSRVVGEAGTQFEFLRIASVDGGLALLASPGGKPPVAFRLVESADGLAVFSNPDHDFPQRIGYRREGDEMRARVEAVGPDGEWGGFEIAWRHDPAGWEGGPAADTAALAAEVRATEIAFARTMADRDPDAFLSFVSSEAIFLSSVTARGRDEVAERWSGFFETPEAPFSWSPETVEVLASGDLALSTGPVHGPGGELLARFNSIWRREGPGRWRIVFDKGEAVCPE